MSEVPVAATRTIRIEVLRYRPEQESEPVWQGWDVPFSDDMSVLQGLQYIKDELDGSLSFRWSCRMAICGSCGMMVDGKPRLACQTCLRDHLPAEDAADAVLLGRAHEDVGGALLDREELDQPIDEALRVGFVTHVSAMRGARACVKRP